MAVKNALLSLITHKCLMHSSGVSAHFQEMITVNSPSSGRTPIPPPLRSKFLVIEQQREEEAARGEQPLDQVLAAVPVPPVRLQSSCLK